MMDENNSQLVRKFMHEDMRRLAVTIIIVIIMAGALSYWQRKTNGIEKFFQLQNSPVVKSNVSPTPTTTVP